jgi:IrrE N-terminal-like domain
MFRRGFKTWAEQTSARVRQNLKLPPTSPLNPLALAASLNVDVMTPTELGELPSDIRERLLGEHSDDWSAITVTSGQSHLVITNSSHSPVRLNSDLAHELAHIILGHEPSLMYMSVASGLAVRTYNDEQEEEANWLAGCLLLPRAALVEARRKRFSDDMIGAEYGVSAPMLRYRLNITGVNVQSRRTRRF